MKLLRRSARARTRADRAGERYLVAGAEEARQLGHGYVGTEHVLLALTREPEGAAAKVLSQLGVTHEDLKGSACLARLWAPRIDADALAALGIDLESVRDRLEESFGPGALERTRSGMLDPTSGAIQCIAPRLKRSLEAAVARAGDHPLRDEHVLLGMLSVSDSLAARVLAEFDVSLAAAEALVRGERQ
jgi:ATP-dependent Clp protease ATP-binding subunit ClpA